MPVRKIKAGYSNLTAKVPSAKLGRSTSAESSLERDFLLLLDNDSEVTWFEEQPLVIEYGKRQYTPDVLVKYSNGSKVLYEVKYRDELKKNWEQFKPKFKAAICFAKSQSIKFKIVTEVEIRTPKLKNIEFLSHFSRTVSSTEDATRKLLVETLFELRKSSPRELLAACFSSNQNRAAAVPVLWRLIHDGTVSVELNVPLTMFSLISIEPDSEERL